MGLVYEYLTFAGKSSEDFKAHISGMGTFVSTEREVETISIPGRNGDLHIDGKRYKNIPIEYPAFITEDFAANYDALKAFFLQYAGYEILTDSYHPDHFRKARFTGNLSPEMAPRNIAASFTLSFDCDPRMFLNSGNETISVSDGDQLFNDTLYTALPLIRAYGTGTMTINDISLQITAADGYTDIDCEIEEAYKGSTNCNSNIILTDEIFPELPPGLIDISLNGLTLDIIPRWWTL